MTNLEALQLKIEPYEVSEGKLELALTERGLQTSDAYDPTTGKETIIRAAIDILWSLITLTKEKDNGSEVDYDVDTLKDLISHYQKQLGEEDESQPKNRDRTHRW